MGSQPVSKTGFTFSNTEPLPYLITARCRGAAFFVRKGEQLFDQDTLVEMG